MMDVELTAAREVNFRSDFDLMLELRDCRGELVGWPAWDWRAVFWTRSAANAFEASCIGGVCRNCFNDGGRIHVVFDGHGLSAGELKVRFTAELPSELYPDGRRCLVVPAELGVVLTRKAACPHGISAELVMPYVKGKFEDLTEEERAELARPATEAAAKAEELLTEMRETLAPGPVVSLETDRGSRIVLGLPKATTVEVMRQYEYGYAYGYAYGITPHMALYGLWDIDAADGGEEVATQ